MPTALRAPGRRASAAPTSPSSSRVQTGQLGSLATTVRSLITNPPSSLDDLTASLGDLPVPDLGVGPQFAGMLGDLRAAVPTDISSVIGPLTTGLDELEATVGPGLTTVLAGALDVVLAVQRLATTDFRCLGIGGGTGANGNGGPPAARERRRPATRERRRGAAGRRHGDGHGGDDRLRVAGERRCSTGCRRR